MMDRWRQIKIQCTLSGDANDRLKNGERIEETYCDSTIGTKKGNQAYDCSITVVWDITDLV